MYEITVAVIILVLLVLIGVISYYIYDYYNYKKQVASDMETDRSNVKNVVGQINTVNADIDSRFGLNEDDIKKNDIDISDIKNDRKEITTGIDKVVRFYDQANQKISLNDLSGASRPDMRLMSHVTSVGGMTINDLDKTVGSVKRFKICGPTPASGAPICTEFPDDNGDIKIAPLYQGSKTVLSGDTSITGSTSVNAPLTVSNNGVTGAVVSALSENVGFIKTGSLGIGATVGTPGASLHLMSVSSSAIPPLKVTVDGSDVVTVDKNGKIAAKSIEIKKADNTTVLSVDDAGITLNAPTVNIMGTVTVNGVAYQPSAGSASTGTDVSGGTVSGFSSGPIMMGKKNPFKSLETPVDFMNSPYLIPVN